MIWLDIMRLKKESSVGNGLDSCIGGPCPFRDKRLAIDVL